MFSSDHIWIKKDGNDVFLGLSAYAVKRLKAIMFISLPEPGEALKIGEKFGDVESVKTVSDLISPVSGEVLEVNESVIDDPETIMEAPYESWLVRAGNVSFADGLMDREHYEKSRDAL